MKKKKGFTLIELLAVIVILAIIMVIAIPKILNVIENSKKEAAKASTRAYIKALKLNQATADLTNNGQPLIAGTYKVNSANTIDGVQYSKLNDYVTVKGSKPTAGTVTITKTKNVSNATLCIQDYITRYLNGNVSVVGDDCDEMGLVTNIVLTEQNWVNSRIIKITFPVDDDGTYKYFFRVSGNAKVNGVLVEKNKDIETTHDFDIELLENQKLETWMMKGNKKVGYTEFMENKIDTVKPTAPPATAVSGYPIITPNGIGLSMELEIKNTEEGSTPYYSIDGGEWIKYTGKTAVQGNSVKVKNVRNQSKISSEEKTVTITSSGVTNPLPSSAYNGTGFTKNHNSNAWTTTYYAAVSSEMYNKPINLKAVLNYSSYWGVWSTIGVQFYEDDKKTTVATGFSQPGKNGTNVNKDLIIPEGTKYVGFVVSTSHASNNSDLPVTNIRVSVIKVIEPQATAKTIYPLLTSERIKRQVELNVTSTQSGASAYYSIDDGANWTKYTPNVVLETNSIKVKMINDSYPDIQSSIKTISITEGSNVLPMAAYNGNKSSGVYNSYEKNGPSNKYYLSVSDEMIGKTINIKAAFDYSSYWSVWGSLQMKFLGSDKSTEIADGFIRRGSEGTSLDKNFVIPSGTKYIEFTLNSMHASNNNDSNVHLYEVSIVR